VTVNQNPNGTTYAEFTVTLQGEITQPVTVDYSTQNNTAIAGKDFLLQTGKLTFTSSQTSQTLRVQLLNPRRGDVDNDGDVDNQDLNLVNAARNTKANPPKLVRKSFFLDLSNPQKATLADNQGVGLIELQELDPRDLDGDGQITILDARILVTILRGN
jgi:hypothetical protein